MSDQNNIPQQAELELDCVRVKIQVEEKCGDPESDIIKETLRPVLSRYLTDAEYGRLEQTIRQLDYQIDLIHRDRKIYEKFRQLRQQEYKVDQAVQVLAREFFISEEHIYTIVYGKQPAYKR